MNKQIQDALARSMQGIRLPRYQELPNVGFYLEQTCKYINHCVCPIGFEEVTGSMVRNYVKLGLIDNPVKKQYSAEQIAYLIAVAILKPVIPLENISDLFRLLKDGKKYTSEVAYDYFCEELENILYFRFGLKDGIEDIGVTSSIEKEMLRSAITAVSHGIYLKHCFRILGEISSSTP